MPIEMKPVKSIGEARCLAFSLARSGPSPAMTSRADAGVTMRRECVSAAVSVLSTDSRPQWTNRICVGVASAAEPGHRVEGLQVYAQWDGDGICRSDAVEFFARTNPVVRQ